MTTYVKSTNRTGVYESDEFQEDDANTNFVDTLGSFTEIKDDLDHLSSYQEVSSKWLEERRAIIQHLRDLADNLEKIHCDVLIADKVGTGIGMGGGVLTIGGLIAAPFTAGISLGFSLVGAGASFLGGLTSIGSNVTEFVCNKVLLDKIRIKLEEHQISSTKLADLVPTASGALARLSKFRPTLERMAEMSEQSLQNLFEVAVKILPQLTNGNSDPLYEVFDQVDPAIMKFLNLQFLKQFLSGGIQTIDLARFLSFFKDHIKSIKSGLNAFVVIREQPELTKLAMALTRLSSFAQKSPAVAKDVLTVRSAFKRTPLGLSATMRGVAGAATALFLAADVYYMIRLCQDKNETPTVASLREMAHFLEKDIL